MTVRVGHLFDELASSSTSLVYSAEALEEIEVSDVSVSSHVVQLQNTLI